MAGIYYDRNNSLLASMVFSDTPNNIFRLNMYPGFLSSNAFVPGFFITIAHGGSTIFGITTRLFPLGLALHKPGEITNYYNNAD